MLLVHISLLCDAELLKKRTSLLLFRFIIMLMFILTKCRLQLVSLLVILNMHYCLLLIFCVDIDLRHPTPSFIFLFFYSQNDVFYISSIDYDIPSPTFQHVF